MKTLVELPDWIATAREELGDPSIPVGQLFVRYQLVASLSSGVGDLTCTFAGSNDLLLNLDLLFGRGKPLALALNLNVPQVDDDASKLVAFGVREVAPGVWFLTPSLNLPGFLHVFVVVYDVPSPAPWERLIVSPAEARS